jgi:hypothetical protein
VFCAQSVITATRRAHLQRAVYDARKPGPEAFGVDSGMHVYGSEARQALRETTAREGLF